MEITSTITAKGQTTIPREIRQKLGLSPRQKIVYRVEDNGVRIEAAGGQLSSAAGSLAGNRPAMSKAEERAAYRKTRGKRYQI